MYGDLRAALESLAPVVGLALLGGTVRMCRFGITSWKQFLGSLAGSAFAGILANWVLAETEFSPSFVSAIIATAGYSGGTLLDAAQARLVSAVGPAGARPEPDEGARGGMEADSAGPTLPEDARNTRISKGKQWHAEQRKKLLWQSLPRQQARNVSKPCWTRCAQARALRVLPLQKPCLNGALEDASQAKAHPAKTLAMGLKKAGRT